ncbi:MAG: hypothetical protein ACOYN3_09675 [Acidimicrobiia bacterium]
MELRPMRAVEIVDAAFTAYRSRFAACITRSVAVTAPTWLVLVALSYAIPQDRSGEFVWASVGFPVSVVTLLMAGTQYFALIVVSVWCTARISLAFSSVPARNDRTVLRQQRINIGRRWRVGAACVALAAFLWGSLLVAARLTVTLPAIRILVYPIVIFVGIVVAVLLSFAPAIVVLEHERAFRALRRSTQLVRYRFGATLWSYLLGYLIAIVLISLCASVFALFLPAQSTFANANTRGLVAMTTASILATFLLPLVPSIALGAYLDARVRREGLDLALAAGDVGQARKGAIPV